MSALLQLPAELRLKIYALAISSQPYAINIDEGATSKDPPRSIAMSSLALIDEQLQDELLPLYWSNNTFEAYRLMGMGHYISTDWTYGRWLRDVVKDAYGSVRYLKFKGGLLSVASLEAQEHESDCVTTVEIDVALGKFSIWDAKGKPCTCDHSSILQSRMEVLVKQLPRVRGFARPNQKVLWDLFECWYIYHPARNRQPRSWDEFQRRCAHYGP